MLHHGNELLLRPVNKIFGMSDSDALVRPAGRPYQMEQAIWPLNDAGVTHDFSTDRWLQERFVIFQCGPIESVSTVSKVQAVLAIFSE